MSARQSLRPRGAQRRERQPRRPAIHTRVGVRPPRRAGAPGEEVREGEYVKVHP